MQRATKENWSGSTGVCKCRLTAASAETQSLLLYYLSATVLFSIPTTVNLCLSTPVLSSDKTDFKLQRLQE